MTQLKLNGLYVMIIIYVISYHRSHTSAEDICEKDLEKLKSEVRSCGNPCATSQCKNPRANCVCDGPCGYVCVTPDLRCSSALENPKQGQVDVPTGAQFQSIAEYACDEGFDLIGPKHRMCQSDGKWSGNEPFCTPKGIRCSEPEFEIENAYIVYNTKKDEYYVGDEVKFTCELGYASSRRDILTTKCEKRDENTADWTPIQLSCKPVFCRKPEDIENGYYDGKELILGSEIKYHCNQGYYLVGFNTRICLAERVWSSSPPTCEIVQCLEPPKLANGEIHFDDDDLHYLSFIQYKCNAGYVLEGPSVRQCDESGKFTGNQPECIKIDCGNPEKPENGTIAYIEGTQLNEQVHYQCDPHTTSHGATVAVCKFEQQVARWTPPPPLCIQHCKVPDKAVYAVHQNEKFESGKYISHKENVRMYCESGYEVDNRASNSGITSTCVNGKWDEQINCKPARCHKNNLNERYLEDQHWSTYKIPSTASSGANITLSCDAWYPEADKVGVLKCAYGKWQLPEPEIKCRKKSCDITHVPFPYGNIYHNEKKIDAQKLGKILDGEYLELTCITANYELYINKKWTAFQLSQVYCNEGVLSKNTFECRQKSRCECSLLIQKLLDKGMKPNNCYNKIDNRKNVDVVCLEGYSNPSARTAKCLNTLWQIDNNAKCKRKCDCSLLQLPKSVKQIESCRGDVRSDTSLTLECASGFTEFAGSEEATCSEGEWLVEGYCHASCSIPNIPRSIISTAAKAGSRKILTAANKIYHKDRIRISCHNGYYLDNQNDILQCINGLYNEELPKCIQELNLPDYCTLPTTHFTVKEIEITDGDNSPSKETSVESSTTIVDEQDSTSEIADSTTILAEIKPTVHTGTNHTIYRNRCIYEPKDKNLLAFVNGTQLNGTEPTSINVKDVITFRCFDIQRFLLEGNNSIKCQLQKWKGEAPTCHRLILRSTDNAPVITYNVEPNEGYVSNNGTLIIPQDSTLLLRCWWFKHNRDPVWKWNDQTINFKNVEQNWNKDEYYELVITEMQPEHSGYVTCTSPLKKTHGINVKVEEKKETPTASTVTTPKPTTPTKPTTMLTTTEPVTTRPTMSSRKCQAGKKANLDIFLNGKLTIDTEYFNHSDGLIFRCKEIIYFKLIGETSIVCDNGKWTSKWPNCLKIYANSDHSPPPVHYLSSIQNHRLGTGNYWAESYADHYFLCYYGSLFKKPIMEINDIKVTADAGYDYTKRVWYVQAKIASGITKLTFKCQISGKSKEYSNTVTVFLQDKCELDEVSMQNNHKAVVIPRFRRFPFYVRGDVVSFQCDSSGKTVSFPESTTCGGGGAWIKSHHIKHCP